MTLCEEKSSSILPFIKTDQSRSFDDICEYARKHQVIALVAGRAGSGKTVTAQHYARNQEQIAANGLSPVLYFQLAQSDKTDRSFANTLVSAITNLPAKNVTAAVAMAEAKRLLQKYRYDTIIIDEVGFLQESGLEAVRTLHDQTNLPIILITMPDLVDKLERYPQFYSRIAQIFHFEGLSRKQLKTGVLPKLAKTSLLTFDPEQEDADKIVDALFRASGGTNRTRANFRNIAHILLQANDLLEIEAESLRLQQQQDPTCELPPLSQLDKALIYTAANYAKGLSFDNFEEKSDPEDTSEIDVNSAEESDAENALEIDECLDEECTEEGDNEAGA